jgi:hypothetical protein
MDNTEIILEEYKTLRQESLNTMSNRISILSFGLASISLIVSASVVKYEPEGTLLHALVPGLALSVAVPAVAIFTLYIWLGEYQRMQRAGGFIAAEIEHAIEKGTLLKWETHLIKECLHMLYPYSFTIALLLVVSGLLCMFGLAILFIAAPPSVPRYVVGVVALVALGFHVTLYLRNTKKLKDLHRLNCENPKMRQDHASK